MTEHLPTSTGKAHPKSEELKVVMLVEDNPVFEDQLRYMLQTISPKASVHSFASGVSAIRAVRSRELAPDLALIDIGLPDISGIAVIQALRDISPETPSLVLSVLEDETKLLEAIRAGAKGYLLKGESPEAIARGVQEVLDYNYPISPALARSLFEIAGLPEQNHAKPQLVLTDRERETLHFIAQGLSYCETANSMGVSLSTVQTHIRSLYRKLGVNSQVQAVEKAKQKGII
jgi:DNA-binding NarL/FixJ family response regulator